MKKLIIILMMFLANNVLADSYNCTTTGMYTNCNGGGNSSGSDSINYDSVRIKVRHPL